MPAKSHWEQVYASKATDAVSWFQPHAERSLRFIEQARLPPTAAIIDVGGGASTLVDDLLARGFQNLTVLDLSARAPAPSPGSRPTSRRPGCRRRPTTCGTTARCFTF